MEYNGVSIVILLWGFITFGFGIAELVLLRGNFFHFSLGGVGALICYLLGMEFPIQLAVFVVVTLLSFLLLRPLFFRIADKNATVHEEGLDLLVGLEGVVIQKIDVDADTGRIDINGRPVKAIPVDPLQKYNVGDRVEATGLEGDRLIVRKARKRK
ncbi:MAG: NfeD family protein [Coriobacteriia bacterium]|nr:NfeD family protein [Coriobacteriia bacterium]